jgi:hypothetical protein
LVATFDSAASIGLNLLSQRNRVKPHVTFALQSKALRKAIHAGTILVADLGRTCHRLKWSIKMNVSSPDHGAQSPKPDGLKKPFMRRPRGKMCEHLFM